jgi:hypothetical protein
VAPWGGIFILFGKKRKVLRIVFNITTCRKRKELHERRKWKINNRKRMAISYKGQKVFESDENVSIQEEDGLVVVGADVEGVYPSLPDVEVAIVYKTVLESGIKFESIDYQKAMHLSKEEHMRSPLARVLPRRTSKGGV